MVRAWIAILSVISGILYRMGGASGYNTKVRDFGVPSCMVIALYLLGFKHWTLILVFGLAFASLTTYFKKKGTDAKWYHWGMVGLTDGLSLLPLIIAYGNWEAFILRTITTTICTIIWSEINGNAVWEENGRGVIRIATLPIMVM